MTNDKESYYISFFIHPVVINLKQYIYKKITCVHTKNPYT